MFWILLITDFVFLGSVFCETCVSSGLTYGLTCKYGCCGENTCCSELFWNWSRIVGVVIAGTVGLIVIGVIVLACIYCKNKKSLAGRLRHTVSMRSQNRIYPFSYPLPSYEEIQADSTGGPGPPYPVLPPRYEDVILPDVPQPQISRSEPSRSNSYRGNI